MGIKCGIVGLPNVGKSTLFNALTKAGIAAENFPFCTIDPNSGIVPVPDARLNALAEIVKPEKVVPTVEDAFTMLRVLARAHQCAVGHGVSHLAHAGFRALGHLLVGGVHGHEHVSAGVTIGHGEDVEGIDGLVVGLQPGQRRAALHRDSITSVR